MERHAIMKIRRGSNSVGRVSASQAEGHGFESRLPLHPSLRTVPLPVRFRLLRMMAEGFPSAFAD